MFTAFDLFLFLNFSHKHYEIANLLLPLIPRFNSDLLNHFLKFYDVFILNEFLILPLIDLNYLLQIPTGLNLSMEKLSRTWISWRKFICTQMFASTITSLTQPDSPQCLKLSRKCADSLITWSSWRRQRHKDIETKQLI